jgi:uncharacterized protein (TIGR03437 family)
LLTTLYAPIIMVSSNQVNAMVRWGVASGIGGGSLTLVVQNNGSSASFANIALVNENPGIFHFVRPGNRSSGRAQ